MDGWMVRVQANLVRQIVLTEIQSLILIGVTRIDVIEFVTS